MIRLEQIREGSIVFVRGGFGAEPATKALVEEVEEDIKNGRPGITYREIATGNPRWAYLNQVQTVVSY